ncbi:kinase-like protein [Ceratobasidium sp. AG-I]|nr:kinase-like protein [Ceratobasidium sp. AG-I]
MHSGIAPPPYTLHQGQSATFAEVAAKIKELSGDRASDQFEDALKAFKTFLTHEEGTKLSKDQLKVLRSLSVSVLEECARQSDSDAVRVLPSLTERVDSVEEGNNFSVLNSVSTELESIANVDNVLDGPNTSKGLEEVVGKAFEAIDAQLREMGKGQDGQESTLYREELVKARENDRKKITELEGIVKQLKKSRETFDQRVQDLMQEQLKIIGDKSEARLRQEHAKQALALITELTGKSLPPSTLLDREFVSIGKTAINQGNSYDIFLGEYFTGEKIAIKVLRQRVSGDTVQKMHERFARQTMNWASLRHDSILPFYGIGVMGSPVSEGEFQLDDVKQRHLKKYEITSPQSRLQVVYDIARGLQYMHEDAGLGINGLVHSALNPSNVLIKDSGRAAISGFGHAKILEGFQENFSGDNPGYRYMGPEMIDESILAPGNDIWAWAMTSLEASRRPKRRDHPKIEEYKTPDVLWKMFERCWELNHEDRPGAADLVSGLRPLLQQFSKKKKPAVESPPLTPYGPNILERRDYDIQPTSKISRNTPAAQVIEILGLHKCPNVTSFLDIKNCTEFAVACGGFSDVYSGRLKDGTNVAIKYPRIMVRAPGKDCTLLKEIYVWSKLKHPNILEPVGVALFRDQMCLVSLWMDGGSLRPYLLPRPDVDRYQMTHGDIKGQNVLVSKDGVAKLTDFGSTRLKEYTLKFTGENDDSNFTLRWTSPEQLNGGGYSLPGDIYGFGMTILEAFTGQVPHADVSEMAILGKVSLERKIPQRPIDCLPHENLQANTLWKLLVQCWAYEPETRPSAVEVSDILHSIANGDMGAMQLYLSFQTPVSEAPSETWLKIRKNMLPGSLLFLCIFIGLFSALLSQPLFTLSFGLLSVSVMSFLLGYGLRATQ